MVETPDFEGICNCFIKAPIRLWATRDLLIRSAYGSQEADWAFHRDGWYEDKFKEVLPKLGFTIELIKKKHSYIRNENGVRYRLPNILVIAKKMADLNTSSYWNSVWEKWRHDDKKSYLKAMFDRANTPDYWDKIWSNPKRRVEKYSMQRCWWHIQKEKPKTVLEVGCGNGRLLFGVKDIADCYGIDLSSVAIERMKNEYEINGEVLNAYDVDKLDRKFDFVVANHLLEHLYRDEEFLSKVKKIMNDGGTFFCSVPNDMSSPEETEEHVRKYNREMLESLINKVFGNCEIEIVGNHLIGISKKC